MRLEPVILALRKVLKSAAVGEQAGKPLSDRLRRAVQEFVCNLVNIRKDRQWRARHRRA